MSYYWYQIWYTHIFRVYGGLYCAGYYDSYHRSPLLNLAGKFGRNFRLVTSLSQHTMFNDLNCSNRDNNIKTLFLLYCILHEFQTFTRVWFSSNTRGLNILCICVGILRRRPTCLLFLMSTYFILNYPWS